MPPSYRSLRVVACLLLWTYAAGCTRQVARPAVETRHFAVDWQRSSAPAVALGSLTVRGIVLTPAQFPLEGSLKRLLLGDFIGVIDGLNLRFRSGTVPSGALRNIFDAGFLPVYLRVVNETQEPQVFSPQSLVVRGDPGRQFESVRADELPRFLRRMDWERTAVVTLAALVLVAAVAAGRDAKIDPRIAADLSDVSVRLLTAPEPQGRASAAQSDANRSGTPADPGILVPGILAPGDTREGFLFFAHRSQWVDWDSVKLAVP